MSVLSWQAGTAAGPFLVGTIIQALITVNNPNYIPENWQGTLLIWAATIPLFIVNVWGSRAMPMIQNIMLGVHVLGFLAVILTLWILSPRNEARVVFTQFTNGGGWNSMGLSLMVGQISAIYGLICTCTQS
jgi:choline transport protein